MSYFKTVKNRKISKQTLIAKMVGNQVYQYIQDKIGKKSLMHLRTLDYQISRNLADAGIETRTVKTNGLWCSGLLPAILIINTIIYKVSPVYQIVACISLGIFFYCLLFTLFMSVSCLVLKETIFGGCIASGLVSVLLLCICLGEGLMFSLTLSLPLVYLFSMMLRWSLTKFPKTYTIGEAMIVTQAAVLFLGMFLVKIMYHTHSPDKEMDFITVIIFTGLSTVGLIVTALCLLTDEQRNIQMFEYIFGAAAVFALITLHLILGRSCIFDILKYVFMDHNRAKLFSFWLSLVLIASFFIVVRSKLAVKANTVTRKTFHVLASVVFLSGIIYDVYLMTLAAGVGLGLLIFVEALRKSGIDPISSSLQSAFEIYKDEKDMGAFAMTPMYLYAGLACPLLLVPQHEGCEVELLSGVLAIGVGDTAASWFGSRYGFNRWADSNRTFEGTAFNVMSQIATVHVLELFGLLNSRNALLRAGLAATVSGLVEAKTDQVDNLVLPLITILAFQATWFMS